MQLALAMLTAPRPRPTLDATVHELRWGGFSAPLHIFAEPGCKVGKHAGLVVHWNEKKLGMWRNWLQAARHLLKETPAEHLMIVEDDVQFAHGAADSLRDALQTLPHDSFGYLALYTPEHNTWGNSIRFGWQTLGEGNICWGSLALAFTRDSLRSLLHSRAVNVHVRPNETDYVIWQAAKELNRQIYFHVPSLCAHEGRHNSTVGNHSTLSTRAVLFDPDYHRRVADVYRVPARVSVVQPANDASIDLGASPAH